MVDSLREARTAFALCSESPGCDWYQGCKYLVLKYFSPRASVARRSRDKCKGMSTFSTSHPEKSPFPLLVCFYIGTTPACGSHHFPPVGRLSSSSRRIYSGAYTAENFGTDHAFKFGARQELRVVPNEPISSSVRQFDSKGGGLAAAGAMRHSLIPSEGTISGTYILIFS